MTWNITLVGDKIERITSTGITVSPDGSLCCINGPTGKPKAIYNARYWCKVEPSSIQDAEVN